MKSYDKKGSRGTKAVNIVHLCPPQFRKVGVETSQKLVPPPHVAPPSELTMLRMCDLFIALL